MTALLAPDALPFEVPHAAPAKSKPRPKAKKKETTAVMPKANAATLSKWCCKNQREDRAGNASGTSEGHVVPKNS